MTLRPIRTAFAAAFAGMIALAVHAAPAPRPLPVVLTPVGGHLVGSPAAKIHLVEYMSYTCPHCAHFNADGMPPLVAGYILPGKVSLEIRHLLRDPLDATAAQLTNCAPPARFLALHEDMLAKQDKWLTLAQQTTEDQRKRWETGDTPTRMRAIAADLHFYDIAARHGVDHAAADRCLASKALSDRLVAQTQASAKAGIEGTPGFMIGDMALAGTANWAVLKPQLDVRLP